MKNFIYTCILFLIIIIFVYINYLHTVESFSPTIKEIYRPYIRDARIIGENFYNKTNSNISNLSNLFRKFQTM
jgi:uncharacterized membrane protein